MKRISLFSCLLLLGAVLFMTSCSKGDQGDTGPQGEQGEQGEQGVQGEPGNANVIQYTYEGPWDFSVAGEYLGIGISMDVDTFYNTAWFCYLITEGGVFVTVPGSVPEEYDENDSVTAYSTYSFYTYYSDDDAKGAFIVEKTSGTGISFQYARIVGVRFTRDGNAEGGRVAQSLPDIDFTDYNAVKAYYHLSDDAIPLRPVKIVKK